MPQYRYRARTRTGEMVYGKVEGTSERDALANLQRQGMVVSRLQRVEGTGAGVAAQPIQRGLEAVAALSELLPGKLSTHDLAILCQQLSTMIGAGLSILVSLRVIASQTTKHRLRRLLEGIAERLEAGDSLSEAFSRYQRDIPPLMVQMIGAGEVGGILQEVFGRLAQHFEKEHAINQKVNAALVYPKIVVVAAAGVVSLLVTFVVPNFVDLYEQFGAVLPLPTRLLMAASAFLGENGLFLLSMAVLSYVGFRVWIQTDSGREISDEASLRFPVFGEMVLLRACARFSRTMATLLSSGVPILTALQVVEKTMGNRLLERAVHRSGVGVRAGKGLTAAMRDSPFFPPMLLEMVRVGEETGALDDMLQKVADFYERQVDSMVQRLTSLLEPAIILGLAGIVGFILLSIFLPMFRIVEQIR